MSVVRLLVTIGLLLESSSAGAKPTSTAIVNLAAPEAEAVAAAKSLWQRLVDNGFSPVADQAVRHNLEQPSTADNESLGAEDSLRRASDEFAEFEFARALASIETLQDRVLSLAPSPDRTELLAEAQLLAGRIHEGQGDEAAAMRHFAFSGALDPKRKSLDPGLYRPTIVSLYAQANGSGHSGEDGSLQITSANEGTSSYVLYVDGNKIGGHSTSLSAGLHWVLVTAPGFRSEGRLVTVHARQQANVAFALEPVPASELARDYRQRMAQARSHKSLARTAVDAATALDVEVMLLVSKRNSGIKVARFDRSTATLSPWLDPSSPRLTAGSSRTDLIATTSPESDSSSSPSWYQTGWGKGLIVAGGLVVGGAILYAATADSQESNYQIDVWCFEGSCP